MPDQQLLPHQHEPTSFSGKLIGIEYTIDDAYHPGVLLKISSSSGRIVDIPIPAPTSIAPYEGSWTELLEAVDWTVSSVIRGWDDISGENSVFETVVAAMQAHLIGKPVAVSRVYHTPVYEISLLSAPVSHSPIAPPTDFTPATPSHLGIASITVESYPRAARQVPMLRYTLEDGQVFVQRLPYPATGAESSEPAGWRPYEMVSGIHAERLASDWREDGGGVDQSALARTLLERITSLTSQMPGVPVNEVGEPDVRQFGAMLMRTALRLGRRLRVYLGRPTQELHEAGWLAVHAKYADRLFVMEELNGRRIVYIDDASGKDTLVSFESRETLGGYLIQAADFALYKPGKPDVCVSPPADLLGFMVANPAPSVLRELRTLARFTRTPTMTKSGRVHQDAGYNHEEQAWLAPSENFPRVSDIPRPEEVREAKRILLEPMMAYPFADAEGGNSAAYAAILTPFAMPMLQGTPRPFFLVDAPPGGQGSGKTKLAQMFAVYADGGRAPPVSPMPKTEDKLNEHITSVLRNSRLVAIIDNIQEGVRSEGLATAATSLVWSTRQFHTQSMIDIPNGVTWIMTANHAAISADIARRGVNITIDVRKIPDGTPAYQRFFHWDPVSAAAARRASGVWAALTLLRNWVASGCQKAPALKMGSFEAWAHIVGGALHAAGIGGLERAIEAAQARDDEKAEHEAFVARWLDMYGGAPVTTPTLATLCVASGYYSRVFEKSQKGSTYSYQRLIKEVLMRLVDRRTGRCYVVETTRSSTGGRRWQLLDENRRHITPRGVPAEEDVTLDPTSYAPAQTQHESSGTAEAGSTDEA